MGSTINTTYITINGDVSNDVLRTSNVLTDGTFPGYNFTINGLEGDDILIASNGPFNWPTYSLAHPTEILEVHSSLVGGAGNDRMYSATGFANLDPTLAANYSHSAYMVGGDGDDLYVLRGLQCSISELSNVGSGNDTVLLTTAYANANGGGFFDLSNFANVENIRVQAGVSDTELFGNGSNNTIIDNLGNGSISGGLGDDTINGQVGLDTLMGDDGNDVLIGAAGNDSLVGGEGNDVLYGGIGNDWLEGDAGNNSLNGGAGADVVVGGTDNDLLIGGDGDDELGGDSGDDDLRGGNGHDVLFSDAGNDFLRGGAGDDVLYGDLGNDILQGGDGNDMMSGGEGNDYFGVDSIGDHVFEYVSEGNDTVASATVSLYNSNFQNVETLQLFGTENLNITGLTATKLIGNDGNNYITADASGSTVIAGAGDDSIYGSGNGNDLAYGGSGNDFMSFYYGSGSKTLDGGDGNDSLNGSSGDDRLIGGAGADYLDGGSAGADTFVFSAADFPAIVDSLDPIVVPIDTIGGFEQGTDKIDITGFGFVTGGSMLLTGCVAFTLADGGLIYGEAVGSNNLVVDINGDGTQDGFINLVGVDVATLSVADFTYLQIIA